MFGKDKKIWALDKSYQWPLEIQLRVQVEENKYQLMDMELLFIPILFREGWEQQIVSKW